jgi:hypothetical protein
MRGWGIFAKGWFLLELAIPFYHDRRRVEDHPKIYELWDNLPGTPRKRSAKALA